METPPFLLMVTFRFPYYETFFLNALFFAVDETNLGLVKVELV